MKKMKAYIGTKWFKFLSLMMTVAFATLLMAPISSYADQLNLTIGEASQYGSMSYLNSPYGPLYIVPMKVVKGGEYAGTPAYCLNHGLKTPPNIVYNGAGSEENNMISWIVSQQVNLPVQQAYFAKQAAISDILGQAGHFNLAYASPVKTAVLNLIAGAKEHKYSSSNSSAPVMTLTPSNVKLTYNAQMNAYVSDNINMNVTGSLAALNMTSNLPSNIQVLLPNGSRISPNSLTLSDTNFKLIANENTVTKSEQGEIQLDGTYTANVVYRYVPTQSGYQEMAVPITKQVNGAHMASLNVSLVPALGTIKVVKTGANGVKLAGAKFEVIQDGKVVGTETTNGDGIANFANLKQGSYTVKEVSAPTGYNLNNATFNANVQAGQTDTLNVSDKQIQGQIKITKTNTSGQPLAGAKFNILEGSKVVATLTTNAKGIAESGMIPFGQYTVKEVTAPVGYNLNTNTFNANIQTQGQVASLTVQDKIIQGQVAVNKVDAQNTNTKVANAVYTIYNAEGKVVDTITTNNDGYAVSKMLDFGKYTMKETSSPTGFLINPTVYNVDITQQGKVYTYNVQDQVIQGKIQIVKINGQTNKPLAGATFGVYANNVIGIKQGTLVDTITSGNNGFAFTKALPYGTYTIQELKAPEKFIKSKSVYNASITTNGETNVHYIKDSMIKARLQILKKDASDNKPLAGVKFEIINADTNKPVEFHTFDGTKQVNETVFTTNAKGEIMTPQPLLYGNYILKEMQTDKGYVLGAPIKFSINRQTNMQDIKLLGEVFTMNVTNKRITGNVQIEKVDATTNKALANAKFKIKCTEGFSKGKTYDVTTNSQGIAAINNLEYGVYEATEIQAPTGYVLNSTPMQFQILNEGQTVKLVKKDQEITNKVLFSKESTVNSQEVAGAKIKLVCTEGLQKGKTIEFTSKDTPTQFELSYGTWTFSETTAPVGYNPTTKTVTINVTKEGVTQSAVIKDTPITGTFTFTKEDFTTSKPVAGAKVKITCVEGLQKGKTWEYTTTTKPTTVTLEYGKYTFNEVVAPKGYVINDATTTFSITKQGEVQKGIIKDKKIEGKAYISKVDATTSKPVAGAKITVTCDNGFDKGESWTWTSTTKAHEITLPYGNYTWHEVDAPHGYDINKTTGHFSISKNGEIVKATIKDKRQEGKAYISKIDATTSKPVAGAKITVKAITGLDKGESWTWTSGTTAHELTLPVGQYTWHEIDAPHGYDINKTIGHFTITNNGITKANIVDKRQEGKAYISKVDATTSKPVAGAKITVKAITGLDKGESWTWTSGTTAHELTLPVGQYTWHEIDAPKGYQINDTIGHFTVTNNGITKAVIKDKKIVIGKAYISKTNIDNGKLVAGAKITVTCTSGADKNKSWTWISTDQPHELSNLHAGTYTYKEIDAPKGYYLNNGVGTFTISKYGQIVKANISDVPVPVAHTTENNNKTLAKTGQASELPLLFGGIALLSVAGVLIERRKRLAK